MTTLHLVEPGGRGGVWQHTIELAERARRAGWTVVVHTCRDHEELHSSINTCPCYRWARPITWRPARLVAVILWFLVVTLPHLRRATRNEIAHIQGQFAWGLYALAVMFLKGSAKSVAFSPHNSFVRSGPQWQRKCLRYALRNAATTVSFSMQDADELSRLGANKVRTMPLVQFISRPSQELRDYWRRRLTKTTNRPLFVLAGQIRPDKGVHDFLLASQILGSGATFAIVGEDSGYAQEALRLRDDISPDTLVVIGYLPMQDFVAVLQVADAVVAPYTHASSSGVVSLAIRAGTAAIAYPVGGLTESGAIATRASTPEALAFAMQDFALRTSPGLPRGSDSDQWLGEIYL